VAAAKERKERKSIDLNICFPSPPSRPSRDTSPPMPPIPADWHPGPNLRSSAGIVARASCLCVSDECRLLRLSLVDDDPGLERSGDGISAVLGRRFPLADLSAERLPLDSIYRNVDVLTYFDFS